MGNKPIISLLPDSAYLSCISLPGTHDSGTAFVSFPKWARCQSASIEHQLEMGVRFLDIRLFRQRGKIKLAHSIANCYVDEKKREILTFEKVLFWCKDFLKNNPREAIVMSIKKERGFLSGSFDEKFFSALYDEYIAGDDVWFTENRIPQLGEVRGKIILLRRCRSQAKENRGLDFSVWKNQDSVNDKEPFKVVLNDRYTADVQDCYGLPPIEKWEVCRSFFEECEPSRDNAVINFLSTTGSGGPAETSKIVNCSFEKYEFGKPCGWVLFNFVNEKYCDKIMQTNKLSEK